MMIMMIMDAPTLRAFIQNNPDFRSSPLHGINLHSPFVLITAETDRTAIQDTILPLANTITEGSVWDLASPTAHSWTTQRNRTPHHQIRNWISQNNRTPWAGILATTQQPFRPHMDHGAYLPLDRGQQVTILAPPFWIWRDLDMLTGTFMVPVTSYTPQRHDPTPSRPSSSNHDPIVPTPSTAPATEMALLGLVTLASFLHDTD